MDKLSFEDLVKHDPPLPIHKGVIPVVSFLWNAKICKAIHPLKLLAVYGGLGALYKSLTKDQTKDQKWLRGGLMTLGMLPILGFSLCTTAAVLMFSKNRKASFESAQTFLLERLESKRAIRKQDKYDVFVPVQEQKIGVIFFPGALVSHTAYAGIAAALSDKGILVVVLSLEPVRFIADTVTNRKIAMDALKDLSDNHDVKIDEWILAGHSAGAMTALNLAIENEKEETIIHPSISKVVLCGVSRNETGSDLGSLRESNKTFSALVVNGTNDGILKHSSEQEKEAFENQLPEDTKFLSIEGGNHAQFAHYGPQSMDGEATISMEEQQKILVETTSSFLSK
eukprot:CAMPEP_0201680986 /NCGR_PEP_ID=MMETSP0494-20130426/50878_1 /ASSEMBLY_ACC=CAM_ASM_000839 /TAXON_ID=420259 /ORGANISM="Thalassiosira gravida, Strain GMp14c1" /LENGTH=339 /DNA_ID=CAMNT_0048164717 /DNA_START=30 /DNA_END=1049 /DNA_ORIENTATION=+